MQNKVHFIAIFKTSDYKENLGLGNIKSFLQLNNIDSTIHVVDADLPIIEQLLFVNDNPAIVGISVYMHIEKEAFFIAKYIKSKSPNTHVFLGGPHITDRMEEILSSHTYIDSVCNGEGEKTVVDLAKRVFAMESLYGCEGITYRNENGEVIKNKDATPIADLDYLPFPDRSIYECHKKDYIYVMGSRGCLGHCTFCFDVTSRKSNCPKVRLRSGKNIADELGLLHSRYGVNKFKFLDSTFDDPGVDGIDRNVELFDEIYKRNLRIRLSVNSRAELIRRYSNEYIQKAKNAGLESIYLGIESGNSEDLKIYGKIATIQDNIEAIALLKKHDLNISYGFINFNPYSSIEKLSENLDFLYKNGIAFTIESLCTFLEVFPQATISKKIKRDGLLFNNYDYNDLGINFIFQDKKTETLFKALRRLPLSYKTARYENNMQMDHLYLQRTNEEIETAQRIYQSAIDLQKSRVKYTYDFFLRCLELAQNNQKQELYALMETDKFFIYEQKIKDLYIQYKTITKL